MKKFVFVLATIVLLSSAPVFAHCGSCGVGDAHDHAAEAASADIVGVASSAGTFNTLLAAAKAAGLVETLQSVGPYTVFAPTDEAFAKLPAGTVEALLANPDKLREILLYHVVPGKVSSADVAALTNATTAQGSAVKISQSGGTVKINDATVIQADIESSNGTIHVIDTVILPS